MESEILLKVCGLKQYFKVGKRTFKAVENVSFEVKKGEVFALVGESGSGKTTTGRAIVGLNEITAGEIRFEGEKIGSGKRISKKERIRLAQNVQMIFQDPIASLNPRMTVGEIVAEGIRIQGVKGKKEIEEKVKSALRMVGLLPEYASRYPHEFSGGQRQRIGIARAVIIEPKMIIADEPVSALDVSVQAQVINLLGDLKKSLGLTVLFIAHDLSVVKYFSDRIAVMYLGRILEQAPTEELFKNPLHPYTKSLFSAIPLPDPNAEKKRKRIPYEPMESGEELNGSRTLLEVFPEHYVFCTQQEADAFREKKK
ncbi:MAG: ABC transporter ATP-binding protein [Clostridia bacterium]|nr:ABC transporter ATP-binding protein [Clostridia bacterium]